MAMAGNATYQCESGTWVNLLPTKCCFFTVWAVTPFHFDTIYTFNWNLDPHGVKKESYENRHGVGWPIPLCAELCQTWSNLIMTLCCLSSYGLVERRGVEYPISSDHILIDTRAKFNCLSSVISVSRKIWTWTYFMQIDSKVRAPAPSAFTWAMLTRHIQCAKKSVNLIPLVNSVARDHTRDI
jgi:hypothetical protein